MKEAVEEAQDQPSSRSTSRNRKRTARALQHDLQQVTPVSRCGGHYSLMSPDSLLMCCFVQIREGHTEQYDGCENIWRHRGRTCWTYPNPGHRVDPSDHLSTQQEPAQSMQHVGAKNSTEPHSEVTTSCANDTALLRIHHKILGV